MWGCSFLNTTPLSGYFSYQTIFPFLFWGLAIFLLVFLAILLIRKSIESKDITASDRQDSLQILKYRYAKGEINEEEFFKMKQVL